MARITQKDWKKIQGKIKFKGTIQKGVRWGSSRKGRATAKAWTAATKEKASDDAT